MEKEEKNMTLNLIKRHNLDIKKVDELIETQNCNNYVEGMISLMIGNMTKQQDVFIIYKFLIDKIIKTEKITLSKLINYSLQFNNHFIFQYLLITIKIISTKEQYKNFLSHYFNLIFFPDPKILSVESFKILANEIQDNIPNKLNDFIVFIRTDYCYLKRDQLLFDATLDYTIDIFYQDNLSLSSGMLQPTLSYLEMKKGETTHATSVASGGNLETFKEVEEKYEVSLEAALVWAYPTTNPNGLDLILYLESKQKFNNYNFNVLKSIKIAKIFQHAIKKYPTTEDEKLDVFRFIYTSPSISNEIKLLAYNLIKDMPLTEALNNDDQYNLYVLDVTDKRFQKKLSERKGYYDLVFATPWNNKWKNFNEVFTNNYELLFNDIKNIPPTFHYFSFIDSLNPIFFPNQMKAFIYLEHFLEKNNLKYQTINMLENENYYQELREKEGITDDEAGYIYNYESYYEIKQELENIKNELEEKKYTRDDKKHIKERKNLKKKY